MQKFFPQRILILFILSMCLSLTNCATPGHYNQRQDGQAFIQQTAARYRLNQTEITRLLAQAHYQHTIIQKMLRPHETLSWGSYKRLFLTPNRIAAGVEFWHENVTFLLHARDEYGIPPEIIVAILGVETNYGKTLGSYRVLDALATLAFDYPPRAAFFRDELAQFILLSHEEHWDPLTVYGSYAGAMGEPQFMPSSYRHYAVDYDHDQSRNLFNAKADIIGSVANYFKAKTWQAGEAIIVPAKLINPQDEVFINQSIKPQHSIHYWESVGVIPCQPVAKKQAASFLKVMGETGPEYYLALHNFYVITLYNASPLYALAVYQLSQAIAQHYQTSLIDQR